MMGGAMTKKTRDNAGDLRGASQLVVKATEGVTEIVKDMHQTIASGPAILGKPLEGPVKLVTDVIYGGIQAATRLVGAGIDSALEQLAPMLGDGVPGPEREAVLAALNGVVGDYLDETNNPLAIEMSFRHGAPRSDDESTEASSGDARTLLVMVHGSCMNDQQWLRSGHDHGAALARDLGYRVAYLHYNSGRHISTNGAEFANALEHLVSESPTPLDEIVIVAHSMGGLVARSACHAAERAELAWRKKLRALVFLGTPHHGSPLEHGGNWVNVLLGISRYSAPIGRLAKIRSAGVTDLRFGNVLDEHWQGRGRFEPGQDQRHPLPLPAGVACYAIAGTSQTGGIGELSGDGLVPVDSALGVHKKPALTLAFPKEHQWTGKGMLHLDLLNRTEVYDRVLSWISPQP